MNEPNDTSSTVIVVLKEILQRIRQHHIIQRGAELGYYLMAAVLALCVALVYMAHFIPGVIALVDRSILSLLPPSIADLVRSALREVRIPENLAVILGTTLTSIWFASRAFHSMIHTFDHIYHIDMHPNSVKAKLLSILFTIALIVLLAVLLILAVAGETISGLLSEHFGIHSIEFLSTLFSIAGMLTVFFLAYYFLPNRRICFRCAVPGAVFATVTWFVIGRVFTYYVRNVATFSWVLGSLGSFFMFMIWIYWCSIVILIGAEINAVVESMRH